MVTTNAQNIGHLFFNTLYIREKEILFLSTVFPVQSAVYFVAAVCL